MRNDAKPAGSLMTVEETARVLRQHRATIYRKIHAGTIPSVRLGGGRRAPIRIDRGELADWLEASRRGPQGGET